MSRIVHLVLAAVVFALAGSGAGASVRTLSHDEPGVTHGVVVGDVTERTAVLWARADREGTIKVHLSGGKHRGVARLKPGITLEQANANVARLIPILPDRFPMPPGLTRKMWDDVVDLFADDRRG